MLRRIASHFIVLEQVGDTLHDVVLLPPNIDHSTVFGASRTKRWVVRVLLRILT